MNAFNIKKAFKRMRERHYNRLYWLIDIHDTIFVGKFDKHNREKEFYPYAKEVLTWLSIRPDMCIILWSSAHKEPVQEIANWLDEEGIIVDYLGENPEMKTGYLCDFSRKLAFDIGLDDKFGFEGETDWKLILDTLKEIGEI
jgi:hypothetical protein